MIARSFIHRYHIAGQHGLDAQSRNAVADQTEGWKTNSGGHFSDLPVLPFGQDQTDPGGWDIFSEAYRRIPFRNRG